MLHVPERFNRNSPNVTALMPPEESGLWLLERMRTALGLASYEGVHLLDFGCGVRFAQTILNRDVRIAGYTGVDNDRALIEFLRAEVRDPRFELAFLDARHPLYNPGGRPLTADVALPVARRDHDVASMFSVITHQYPLDAAWIFSALRRHVRAGGLLYFTCFLDDGIDAFEDRSAARNGGWCSYNPRFLRRLVEACGWEVVARAPAAAPLAGDSFIGRA